MKNLIICCAIVLSLSLTANAHEPVRNLVKGAVCTSYNIASLPVRVVNNVQPVRRAVSVPVFVVRNIQPVRRTVNYSRFSTNRVLRFVLTPIGVYR